MKSEKKEKKGGKKVIAEASRDYTINLHKRLHKVTFKKKAVRAVREIVSFTKRNMLTEVNKNKTPLFLVYLFKGCTSGYQIESISLVKWD